MNRYRPHECHSSCRNRTTDENQWCANCIREQQAEVDEREMLDDLEWEASHIPPLATNEEWWKALELGLIPEVQSDPIKWHPACDLYRFTISE